MGTATRPRKRRLEIRLRVARVPVPHGPPPDGLAHRAARRRAVRARRGAGAAMSRPLMDLTLFAYAFISNVALAVVPHEPVVIWYGAHAGVCITALVATAGTVAAAWVDHRLFEPVIARVAEHASPTGGPLPWTLSRFRRAPFAV